MFGIRDVRMQNGIKMKLNFWLQNEKPFLTDKTSGQLYEFLSLSSCDKYVKVLKQMVVDIKVHEAEINNANIKIDTLKTINNRKQEFIDENKGFDDIYERTIVASSESKIFNQNVDNLNDIQTLSGGINNAKDKLIGINDKLAKIDIQGVSGRYDKLIELSDLYSNIYNIMTDLKRIKDSIKDTKFKVEEVSDSYDKLSKDELIKKVFAYSWNRYVKIKEVLSFVDTMQFVYTQSIDSNIIFTIKGFYDISGSNVILRREETVPVTYYCDESNLQVQDSIYGFYILNNIISDTLLYSNGLLAYSKVYNRNLQPDLRLNPIECIDCYNRSIDRPVIHEIKIFAASPYLKNADQNIKTAFDRYYIPVNYYINKTFISVH